MFSKIVLVNFRTGIYGRSVVNYWSKLPSRIFPLYLAVLKYDRNTWMHVEETYTAIIYQVEYINWHLKGTELNFAQVQNFSDSQSIFIRNFQFSITPIARLSYIFSTFPVKPISTWNQESKALPSTTFNISSFPPFKRMFCSGAYKLWSYIIWKEILFNVG